MFVFTIPSWEYKWLNGQNHHVRFYHTFLGIQVAKRAKPPCLFLPHRNRAQLTRKTPYASQTLYTFQSVGWHLVHPSRLIPTGSSPPHQPLFGLPFPTPSFPPQPQQLSPVDIAICTTISHPGDKRVGRSTPATFRRPRCSFANDLFLCPKVPMVTTP